MMTKTKIILAVLVIIMLCVSAAHAIFCTKCGTENPNDAKFCYRCANELTGGTKPGYILLWSEHTKIDDISVNEYENVKCFEYSGRTLALVEIPSGKHTIDSIDSNTSHIVRPGKVLCSRDIEKLDEIALSHIYDYIKGKTASVQLCYPNYSVWYVDGLEVDKMGARSRYVRIFLEPGDHDFYLDCDKCLTRWRKGEERHSITLRHTAHLEADKSYAIKCDGCSFCSTSNERLVFGAGNTNYTILKSWEERFR